MVKRGRVRLGVSGGCKEGVLMGLDNVVWWKEGN